MKLLASLFYIFIVNSSLSAQVVEDSTKFDLHVNIAPGETYFYSTSRKQSVIQQILGDTVEMNQEFATDYKYLVESIEDNLIKIKATYERIELFIDSPEDQIRYSSLQENSDSRFSMLNNLIGKSFHIFMDTNGKVYKISGIKELINDLKLGKSVKQLLTDSSLINTLNMDIYPNNAVSMGESWDKTKAIDMANLKLKSNLIYTLEGTSEDLAWLNVNGEISDNSNSNEFEISLKGTHTGTIELDLKSGMIASGDIRMEIEAVIKSIDLEIPLKIISETKTSSRKL